MFLPKVEGSLIQGEAGVADEMVQAEETHNRDPRIAITAMQMTMLLPTAPGRQPRTSGIGMVPILSLLELQMHLPNPNPGSGLLPVKENLTTKPGALKVFAQTTFGAASVKGGEMPHQGGISLLTMLAELLNPMGRLPKPILKETLLGWLPLPMMEDSVLPLLSLQDLAFGLEPSRKILRNLLNLLTTSISNTQPWTGSC